MQQLTILNTREVKKIKEHLQRQFGYALREDYAYLQSEKDKIFIINKDVAKIDLKKVIVDKLGLYFAELRNEEVRLSKEGAQLLGREAAENDQKLNNVVSLTAEEAKLYFQGVDLVKDLGQGSKLVLIGYGGEIIGCSRYKDGKVLNFLPKIHRGEVIL